MLESKIKYQQEVEMYSLKCMACGAQLEREEGENVVLCQHCGTKNYLEIDDIDELQIPLDGEIPVEIPPIITLGTFLRSMEGIFVRPNDISYWIAWDEPQTAWRSPMVDDQSGIEIGSLVETSHKEKVRVGFFKFEEKEIKAKSIKRWGKILMQEKTVFICVGKEHLERAKEVAKEVRSALKWPVIVHIDYV